MFTTILSIGLLSGCEAGLEQSEPIDAVTEEVVKDEPDNELLEPEDNELLEPEKTDPGTVAVGESVVVSGTVEGVLGDHAVLLGDETWQDTVLVISAKDLPENALRGATMHVRGTVAEQTVEEAEKDAETDFANSVDAEIERRKSYVIADLWKIVKDE